MNGIDRRKAGLQDDHDLRDPVQVRNNTRKEAEAPAHAFHDPSEIPEGLARPRTHPLSPTHGRSTGIPAHVPGGRRS